jgi:RecA/RadA recombinase
MWQLCDSDIWDWGFWQVAALVPKAELEGDMGDAQMALQARLMSKALRRLTHSLNSSQCLLIFINQVCTTWRFL